MYKLIITILLNIVVLQAAKAQELVANVEIMSSRVQGVDEKVFTSLKSALTEFLNNRRWSNDVFTATEKIQCNFFLNVTEAVGSLEDNTFRATLTVQASRPVYSATYTTTTFNFLDRDIVFRFDPSQVILFDDNRVGGTDPVIANLPAIFAYYAYMILGFDYDSFSPNGGDPFFKKAQNIVMNAPEDSRLITGWVSNVSRRTNRYWLVEQVLNPRFSELRQFWYDYHLRGLDIMRKEPQKGLQTISGYFEKLKTINIENPTSIYLMTVFNIKSTELINLVAQLPAEEKKTAIETLAEVDVTNAAKYKGIR